MTEITLKVRSGRGTDLVPMTGSRVTIGRGEDASLSIDDSGLSRRHASINRDGRRVWILDERSANGSFVNGDLVPPEGTPLSDGDEITLGRETVIIVNIGLAAPAATPFSGRDNFRSLAFGIPLVAGVALVVLLAASRLFWGVAGNDTRNSSSGLQPEAASSEGATLSHSEADPAETTVPSPPVSGPTPHQDAAPDLNGAGPAQRRLYRDMGDAERMGFIGQQARAITMRISNSNHPEIFDEVVIRKIKDEVDAYGRGRGTTGLWGVDLKVMFARAAPYAPYISRCFNQESVPPLVGLYIVWIETSFVNVASENKAHAMGLFQFIPETARSYGISDPADRTNVQKMAPAAARYMRDRISRFGGDTKGVALAIANYNRGGTPQDLQKTIDKENPDRSFWTLMANKEKLNHFFQTENIHYVPRFFAAAIIGENPWAFGVSAKPLSAL